MKTGTEAPDAANIVSGIGRLTATEMSCTATYQMHVHATWRVRDSWIEDTDGGDVDSLIKTYGEQLASGRRGDTRQWIDYPKSFYAADVVIYELDATTVADENGGEAELQLEAVVQTTLSLMLPFPASKFDENKATVRSLAQDALTVMWGVGSNYWIDLGEEGTFDVRLAPKDVEGNPGPDLDYLEGLLKRSPDDAEASEVAVVA